MESFTEILTSAGLNFIIGTLVLWLCSKTVNTPNSDLKSAALYNAIIVGFLIAGLFTLLAVAMFLPTLLGLISILFLIIYIYSSFWILMSIYGISFLSSLWLLIAMWGVNKLIEMVLGL
ncbi:hypothetical protein P0Y35_08100 [Kiritimatiellaeota bacterium B1221]|nr:hypothetical protein [Kiritimatiellaeota bacterium B1221]